METLIIILLILSILLLTSFGTTIFLILKIKNIRNQTRKNLEQLKAEIQKTKEESKILKDIQYMPPKEKEAIILALQFLRMPKVS